MAREIIEKLIDDLDGSEAAHTIRFGVDGVDYTIDLSSEHASEMRSSLAPYVAVATRLPSRVMRPRALRGGRTMTRGELQQIRDWARSQGLDVSDRGRIPANIIEQYQRANAR